MVQIRCLEKFRDKQNKIYGYRIQNLSNGKIQDIESDGLKDAIRTNQVSVINLKLTGNKTKHCKLKQIKLKRTAKMRSEVSLRI